MPPKSKNQEDPMNLLIPPSVDLNHIPLADRNYKIRETSVTMNFCNFIVGWRINMPIKQMKLDSGSLIFLVIFSL